jgi:carbonic anhydrase
MEKLVRGIHQFQSTHFDEHRELFERLSTGQQPETLMITCSDSRIMPEMLTQSHPGDLFVLRNAGNLVPPYGASGGGEGATIEYAMVALQVSHIVVMGHSHCGAMKGLLHPEDLGSLPLVASWLKHAEATRQVVRENYQDCQGNELLNAAVKENVLVQLDNLRTYPSVAARLVKGNLTLHAWIYQIETGQIFAFDPTVSHFVPLTAQQTLPAIRHRSAIAPEIKSAHSSQGVERAA